MVASKERTADTGPAGRGKKGADLASVIPAAARRLVRDPGFRDRLEQALDSHPHAPAKHQGRLIWIKRELKRRYDVDISNETARKWLWGESRPRHEKLVVLAEMLEVDAAWLSLGVDPDITPRERKVRNAMVDGVVNVIAGFIEMDGGHPAFPDDGDRRAERDNVDLFAIILGANYAFHVALGSVDEGKVRFVVPTKIDNVIVLGVLRSGLAIELFEVSADVIAERGHKRGGSIELAIEPDHPGLKRIESFAERL